MLEQRKGRAGRSQKNEMKIGKFNNMKQFFSNQNCGKICFSERVLCYTLLRWFYNNLKRDKHRLTLGTQRQKDCVEPWGRGGGIWIYKNYDPQRRILNY